MLQLTVIKVNAAFLGVGSLVAICGGLGAALDSGGIVAEAIRFVFRLCTLFNIDEQAKYPGCDGSGSLFIEVFWANLRMMFQWACPTVSVCTAMAALGFMFHRAHTRGRWISVPVLSAIFVARDWLWWSRRGGWAVLMWTNLMLLTLTKLALEAVVCKDVGGKLYMVTTLSQECFTADHTPVFVTSIGILAWCGIGFPAIVFGILSRRMPTRRHREAASIQLFGFVYSPLKDDRIFSMVAIGFGMRLLVALTNVFKNIEPRLLFAVMLSAKSLQMIFVAVTIPHMNKRVTKFVSMQALFGIVGACVNNKLAELSIALQYCLSVLLLLIFFRILCVRYSLTVTKTATTRAYLLRWLDMQKGRPDKYGGLARAALAAQHVVAYALLPFQALGVGWEATIGRAGDR